MSQFHSLTVPASQRIRPDYLPELFNNDGFMDIGAVSVIKS
jgi:hypothetical protein